MALGRWASALALAGALLASAADARAQSQDLSAGRAALGSAAFDAAQSAFEHVIADPAARREEVVEAYHYLAMIRMALGDEPGAERFAAGALALAPAATLPPSAPPEVAAPFARGR